MLSQEFYVIIEHGISETGHDIDLVYVINTIDKRFMLQLISTVKLLGIKGYDTQMVMNPKTYTYDVSLSR